MIRGAYRSVVSTNLLIEAHAIMTSQTSLTTSACSSDPLDANAVTNLDWAGFSACTELDDFTDAFVAADLAWLGGVGEDVPCVCHDAEVGVADA